MLAGLYDGCPCQNTGISVINAAMTSRPCVCSPAGMYLLDDSWHHTGTDWSSVGGGVAHAHSDLVDVVQVRHACSMTGRKRGRSVHRDAP